MKLRFYKRNANGNAERIYEEEVKARNNSVGFSDIEGSVRRFFSEQGMELISTGVKTIYGNEGFQSSMFKNGRRKEATDIGTIVETDMELWQKDGDPAEVEWQGNATLRNAEGKTVIGPELGFIAFNTGYVIGSGATGNTIFGTTFKAYISSIGTAKVHQKDKTGAKVFKSYNEIIKFLEKHESSLGYCCMKYGWQLYVEPASSVFEADHEKEMEMMSIGRFRLENEKKEQMKEVIARINRRIDEEERNAYEPAATPEEEAVNRMESLSLHGNVKTNFRRRNKLMMSEFSGILYDPDEGAMRAVESASKYGTPYHIIKNQTEIGTMYSVLVVSNDRDNWKNEQFSSKTGIIQSVVCTWYPEMDLVEAGEIKVKPMFGGLQRIA